MSVVHGIISNMNDKIIKCPECGDTVTEWDFREVGVCWECDKEED